MRCKRVFDFFLSLYGLVICFPVFVIVALLIKLTSEGGIFYLAPRIGQNGRAFIMFKFRTMHVGADKEEGGSVTILGDPRVTSFGKILRRLKIDELPSLVNVFKGEMSFVGPRPDVPGYADKLEGSARNILLLKPGITGPATLKYANEEDLLAKAEDPKRFNDEVIFPDKVKLNLLYLENWSLMTDVKIILKTIFRTNY
jgi:lipopolysaccharide/colanic/teichoic acid biosynthesis glycosyltransferase